MKRRPLKMDGWGISFDRYQELFHFCQQYGEKKRAAEDLLTLASSMPRSVRTKDGEYAFELRGGGAGGDPVERAAMRREALLRDVRMIEESAREADRALSPWILRAVTQKDGVRRIHPPCGERQFCAARRKFFYILHQKKG